MNVNFSQTQRERLKELGLKESQINECFENLEAANNKYRKLEKEYSKKNRTVLKEFLNVEHETLVEKISSNLKSWLIKEGYSKVSTPTIINSRMLDKMTVTSDKPLRNQVFWVENNKCLRPMLAPNLYVVMRELRRITNDPVKIFEIGSCFRKESQGSKHMNEFTMLNFVNLGGVEEGMQMDELERMAKGSMEALGIENYELQKESSTVYEETLDIVVGDVELASGSFGPHKLDANWGIFDTWVGIGFGIERIAYIKGGYETIARVGRSTNFLDGSTLSV